MNTLVVKVQDGETQREVAIGFAVLCEYEEKHGISFQQLLQDEYKLSRITELLHAQLTRNGETEMTLDEYRDSLTSLPVFDVANPTKARKGQ
jgi:hypothetical protein